MKVADVMSTQVDYIASKDKVRDAARIIFGRGINGLPVCHNKKVVGFIAEWDILSHFYPSMTEYVEDPIHASNFEDMERKVGEVFSLSVDKIMSKSPITVMANTPLLRAQSLMSVSGVGRLPVIDEDKNLIGIISQGDIFRVIVGDNLPLTADQEYHDWQAKHYDMTVDWKKRLGNEIPDLSALFKRKKVTDVLDIGFGTGEHDIALAREGFNVLGVESARLMNEIALKKMARLPESLRKRLEFIPGWYPDILKKMDRKFGAAIFMGNAFPHLEKNYKKVLTSVSNVLLPKDSVIVMQIVNLEKILKVKKRFVDLNFGESKHGFPREHAFVRFYDPPKRREDIATLNMSIFDFDGRKWKHRTLNSTPIMYLDRPSLEKILKEAGFKKVSFYGGMFFGPLFRESFKPLESDWLNVIAER